MVRVKRVYEKPAKEDGWRVLVDRLWPRGLTTQAACADVWMKDVAPSDELRKWFAHDPKKWGTFKKRYRAELADKKTLLGELEKMEKEHGTLTLLFGARDVENNQAVVLAKALKKS